MSYCMLKCEIDLLSWSSDGIISPWRVERATQAPASVGLLVDDKTRFLTSDSDRTPFWGGIAIVCSVIFYYHFLPQLAEL